MGRFTRSIRGFFSRVLTGVEQRNPEILLENAVQDELKNLKRLHVAAARTIAYEKMLTHDAAEKQKLVTTKERQARELVARGHREAAIEVVQQKQAAQASLQEIECRLDGGYLTLRIARGELVDGLSLKRGLHYGLPRLLEVAGGVCQGDARARLVGGA